MDEKSEPATPRFHVGERIHYTAGDSESASAELIIRDVRILRGSGVNYVMENTDTGYRVLLPEREIQDHLRPGVGYAAALEQAIGDARRQAREIARVHELRRLRGLAADRSNHGHGHDR